mmetsp:Transcript_46421/g.143305  ORF Transcript_46421/g.143305 Transcript_46421/m.143305 type:complete len:422 (-) Transcript_46421:490-1755(-)
MQALLRSRPCVPQTHRAIERPADDDVAGRSDSGALLGMLCARANRLARSGVDQEDTAVAASTDNAICTHCGHCLIGSWKVDGFHLPCFRSTNRDLRHQASDSNRSARRGVLDRVDIVRTLDHVTANKGVSLTCVASPNDRILVLAARHEVTFGRKAHIPHGGVMCVERHQRRPTIIDDVHVAQRRSERDPRAASGERNTEELVMRQRSERSLLLDRARDIHLRPWWRAVLLANFTRINVDNLHCGCDFYLFVRLHGVLVRSDSQRGHTAGHRLIHETGLCEGRLDLQTLRAFDQRWREVRVWLSTDDEAGFRVQRFLLLFFVFVQFLEQGTEVPQQYDRLGASEHDEPLALLHGVDKSRTDLFLRNSVPQFHTKIDENRRCALQFFCQNFHLVNRVELSVADANDASPWLHFGQCAAQGRA